MNKGKILVLYYHRVNDLKQDFNLLSVNPENFRQQMLFLKNNYDIYRFEDDWEKNAKGVVVTFDDGYLDNLEYAVPILEELEVPATVFVTTGSLLRSREFWWDELEDILLDGSDIPELLRLEDDLCSCEWKTDTWAHRINCYRAIHFLMKDCISAEKREIWLDNFQKWKGERISKYNVNATLNCKQLRKLAQSKCITIGAHTITHPCLAALHYEEQEKEIIDSIKMIESIIDKKVVCFSYPFGLWERDYSEETMQICQKAGIQKAAATDKGVWTEQCNSLQIPRNCVRNWNLFEFEIEVENFWKV